jgi:hypothetical protein
MFHDPIHSRNRRNRLPSCWQLCATPRTVIGDPIANDKGPYVRCCSRLNGHPIRVPGQESLELFSCPFPAAVVCSVDTLLCYLGKALQGPLIQSLCLPNCHNPLHSRFHRSHSSNGEHPLLTGPLEIHPVESPTSTLLFANNCCSANNCLFGAALSAPPRRISAVRAPPTPHIGRSSFKNRKWLAFLLDKTVF